MFCVLGTGRLRFSFCGSDRPELSYPVIGFLLSMPNLNAVDDRARIFVT